MGDILNNIKEASDGNPYSGVITKYWNNRLERYEYTTHENGEVKFLTYEDGYKKGFEDAVKQIKEKANVRD